MKKKYLQLIFLLLAFSIPLGCSSKSNQKQSASKKINFQERLDSIKSMRATEGYVLFEDFAEKDSYIIYATREGIYKESVWGETTTLLDDSKNTDFEIKTISLTKWFSSHHKDVLSHPDLNWEDCNLVDQGDIILHMSGEMICNILDNPEDDYYACNKPICNEAGILVGGSLFLFDTPNIMYVLSDIKPDTSQYYKFKGLCRLAIADIPDLPNEIYSMVNNDAVHFKYKYIYWPFQISSSGGINISSDEFIFQDKTYMTFGKKVFCEKLEKDIRNDLQEKTEKLIDASLKLDDFTTAYQNNPIKAEQRCPVGSRWRLLVDLDAIRQSDNPYYKYVLRASLLGQAYTYIYTNDESFASKDYPIGCCMEAKFSHFDGGQHFEFVDAEAKAYGPTSYQYDYD